MDRKIAFALVGVSIFLVALSVNVMAPVADRKDPLPSSNFIVEIDGIVSSSFISVEGIGTEMEVIEFQQGSGSKEVQLLPGVSRAGPLTLRRGVTENTELWDWYETVRDGSVDRRAMSVVLQDHAREEKARYNFDECWPSEYGIEKLEAIPSGVAVEVLVVQCETMERA